MLHKTFIESVEPRKYTEWKPHNDYPKGTLTPETECAKREYNHNQSKGACDNDNNNKPLNGIEFPFFHFAYLQSTS